MNDYLLTAILGIVEGITEFLPISSTAHLRITQALLGVDLKNGFWEMFAIVIQIGPILTLPIFFRERIAVWLRSFPGGTRGDRTVLTHPLTLTFISLVFTAVPALAVEKIIAKHLEDVSLIAMTMIAGGIVMWVVDSMFGGLQLGITENEAAREVERMGVIRAAWIGLCQAVSGIFPGTSRSMATISGGQVCGLSRTAALEYSFLLSIPTMVAATGHDLRKALKTSADAPPVNIDAHGWVLLLTGTVISFVVAYIVVGWFMNWVRTRGFVPFAIYRIVFGAAVLAWVFAGAK
ncbi:MAG TPA: undecaprenyl-diphosphate phosphatase [Bryobacteraceae bacterium]|nr:undecaprenyl-diphosphate phosphatase [Bryobacteraceae bacterium]